MDKLAVHPKKSWNGERIWEILQEDQAGLPIQIAVTEHSVQALQKTSWIDFVVRMGRMMAEALAYAHQRDLLHLDLKPSNIVIAPDGQAILLDLDVARPPIAVASTSVSWLGGTRAYMSPEQRAAMDALTRLQPIPCAVDGRSDLYSLGLVLYRALGGETDAQNRPAPHTLPRLNPHVSRGLTAILTRCLADDPADRYPDGHALADDLHRLLHDLLLRGVRNRWSDRWRSWRRRRPLGLPLIVLLMGFCVAAGTAGFNDYRMNEERSRQAETALADGQELQRKGQHDAAIRRFLVGKEIADQTRGADLLRAQLNQRLLLAHRVQKADELNKVVQLLRFYALQDQTPRRMQHVLEAAGRRIWAERELLTNQAAGKLDLAAEKNIRSHLQEFVLLWSDLQVRLAPASHVGHVRGEGQKVLTEAERLFGPSLGLTLAQEQHTSFAARERLQPQATWEFCALGRIALAKGDHAEAMRCLQQALELEPLGFVPNFYFGVSALRQQEHEQALQAFSFCLGVDPCAECFLLRGQTQAALGQTDRALQDFNHALAKNPQLGVAYQQRGNLLRESGRVAEAEKDLQMARKLSE